MPICQWIDRQERRSRVEFFGAGADGVSKVERFLVDEQLLEGESHELDTASTFHCRCSKLEIGFAAANP
jgi:hypothetical protein